MINEWRKSMATGRRTSTICTHLLYLRRMLSMKRAHIFHRSVICFYFGLVDLLILNANAGKPHKNSIPNNFFLMNWTDNQLRRLNDIFIRFIYFFYVSINFQMFDKLTIKRLCSWWYKMFMHLPDEATQKKKKYSQKCVSVATLLLFI